MADYSPVHHFDSDDDAPLLRVPELVGREREFRMLREALSAPAAFVLVEGEAGIGKSRLLIEFLAARDTTRGRALVATCPPFRRPHTLGPLVDAIRLATERVSQLRLSPLAGALRPLFPEWADDLPPAPEPADDPTAVRHRLFRALSELLDRAGVAVLVVEDAHWADEATLEFLLFLCASQKQRRSLVLTCRPEDTSSNSLLRRLCSRQPPGMTVARIGLGPLGPESTAQLMSSMLDGEQISDEFAAFVYRHTDGIPLAVEESIRLMRDRADLARRDGAWVRRDLGVIAVPPSMRDAVTERVEHLGQHARAVLQVAAVLAEPATEAVIAEVARLKAQHGRTGLAQAIDAGLLTEDRSGLVSFRHVLACRAVYESMRAAERFELHGRAGQALRRAAPEPLTQLVRHFREVRDTAAWCRYAEQAADSALAAGDEMTASTLLYELITEARLPGEGVLRLLRKLTFGSLIPTGDLEGLVEALRVAMADPALDPAAMAELRTQTGRVLIVLDEHDAARRQLELAIPDLGDSSGEAVRAMLTFGLPRNADWPATEHLRWLRRAAESLVSLPEAERLSLTLIRVNALLLLGEDEGWTVAAQLPEEPSSNADRRPLVTHNRMNLGDLAIRWGRYEEAARHLARALSLAEAHRHLRLRENALVTQAHLAWLTGRWTGLARRAIGLASDSSIRGATPIEALLVAALVGAVRGDLGRAAEMLEQVQGETLRRGVFEIAVEAAAALARVHLAAGRVADALTVTDVPMRIVSDKGIWLWAADLGPARVDALAAAGRLTEAAELVEGFAEWMRGRDIPSASAGLLLSRAALAQARGAHDSAALLFAGAEAAFEKLPRPYEALLAKERHGCCLLAAGQRDAGLAALSEAERGLGGLGASQDVARVQQTSRGQVIKRAGRPGYGGRLSPRETDVAILVVDGLTNRDIAQRLFLSPRTVAHHVDSAMRKLGVASRTALAVRIVEQGLDR
jgi:DNA-binding CsgD family transcriptional regulator/tetratricopeptide (TPR) repeat protein